MQETQKKGEYMFGDRFCVALYGKSGSGKSYVMKRLLLGPNKLLYKFKPENVIIFAKHAHGDDNPIGDVLKALNATGDFPKNNFIQDAAEFEQRMRDKMDEALFHYNGGNGHLVQPSLFIGDDGQNQLNFKKGSIFDECTTEGRHCKMSCMLAIQYFKAISPIFRTNVTQSIIFDVGLMSEWQKIFEDLRPMCSNISQFKRVVERCFEEEHGFLFIDHYDKNMKGRYYNSMTTKFLFQ